MATRATHASHPSSFPSSVNNPRLERAQQTLAIVLQLADRLAHIVHGQMARRLAEPLGHLRRPTLREFLEGTHVEIAVVKESLQRRHVARQKAPILANAVTAHRRSPR